MERCRKQSGPTSKGQLPSSTTAHEEGFTNSFLKTTQPSSLTWTINNYPKELMLITITTSFSINRLDAHLALACLSWRKLKDGSPYCAGTYVGDGSRQPSELELAQAFHQGKYFARHCKEAQGILMTLQPLPFSQIK
ncbi:hypothetical protein VIGAN_09102100 [Vigna angularis var. angularis]|uniref:Uncharacterized protein n=1 Tax=Vigna angularis var. angularis TaxID=157739 RepID=A0A0S3SXG8_PHAAN|nr:hypothetical protein VIGAN_09102100 [Vigna angularis var. angularis]